MKFAAAAAIASASLAMAMPTAYPIYSRQMSSGSPSDTQVLQYALTLENLEKTFYAQALAQFSQSDFEAAGYPDWVRNRLEEIATHEAEHVALLSGALGNMSVAACNYNFPYSGVQSFISLAALIENVGVSAYAGAAQYITSPAYLTVAAVILSTEARHQSWENSAVLKQSPWSSAYDTPLGLDMVYTIASAFITSCPSSNPSLPVMAYPSLTVSGAGASAAGSSAMFTTPNGFNGTAYAIFYNGLGSQAVQLNNGMATVPNALQGISYVLVSSASSAAAVTTSNILAGPAILDFPFVSSAPNPAFMED